ncbi:hypothetical protein TNCV_681971 [Trichonephila clavipes]|nr:hypothetical protein TNCV_681971 [Trichonephila clavipes]
MMHSSTSYTNLKTQKENSTEHKVMLMLTLFTVQDVEDINVLLVDSDEDIRLNETYCEESEESADVIDNIPVNLDIYVASYGIEWIPHNSNVPADLRLEMFCDKAKVQQ